MTAHELVALVLRRINSAQKTTRSVAATEVYTAHDSRRRVDVVEVHCSWSRPRIVFYEVKSCRQDFLSDKKWIDYLPYCHQFWFVFPAGAVTARDIDDPKIGLLAADTGCLRCVRRAGVKVPTKPDGDLLRYMLWKRQNDPVVFPLEKHGSSDAIRYWAQHRKLNCELAREFHPAILDEISCLKNKIYRLEHAKTSVPEFQELRGVLVGRGICSQYDSDADLVQTVIRMLDGRLPSHVMRDLRNIQQIVERHVKD